ncbi:MAG: hypothetical protein M1817_005658 [Caeruleum heppii]|nr:MAG: hypothetical protein M1817_005658 [Caeruleum heppii]
MSSNSEPAGCSHSDRAVSSSRRRSGRTRESAEQGLVPTYSDAAREFATLDGIPAVDANPASRSPPGPEISPPQGDVESPRPTESTPAGTSTSTQMPSIRFIPHQDPRAPRPSLVFPPVARTLPSGTSVIRVGRYSERDLDPSANPNALSSAPVGFKSKVVSRRHCEFWCSSGQWYIKDVKSSSGTFLNHIRLSQPNTESRPWPVNDGDVVQLGIDFKGGEEMIFRCVKIRVELNRGWQKALNSFNTNTHKRLRNLASRNPDKNPNDAASTHSSECSICLFSIAPCQSLFVAPCSHVWHYKCIRPILNGPTWPQFLCPNCRAIADLEAEVDEPEDWEEDVEQGQGSDTSMRQTPEPHADTAARQDPHGEASGTLENIMSTLAVARADSVELPEQMDREAQPTSVAHESLPASSLASRKGASVVPLNLTQASHSSATGSVVREGPSPDSEAHADNVPDRTSSEGSPPRRDGNRDTVGTEGPMTPRNDAGPFVFDGSAGRGSGHSLLPDLSGTASAENGSQSDSLD